MQTNAAQNVAQGTMADLFDDLSEDWISQPASPRQVTPKTEVLRESKSKLPRYQPTTSSLLRKERPRASSRLSASSEALQTRSPSQLNSAIRPRVDIQRGSGQEGTCKVSPTRKASQQQTPDWKRRLLKGGAKDDEQTDLLCASPKALENVFRPPCAETASPQRAPARRRAAPQALQSSPGPNIANQDNSTQADSSMKPLPPNEPKKMSMAGEKSADASIAESIQSPAASHAELPKSRFVAAQNLKENRRPDQDYRDPDTEPEEQDPSRIDSSCISPCGRYVTVERGLPDSAISLEKLSSIGGEEMTPSKNTTGIRSRRSGSPLKIFDKYDTYTNDRLLSRMSKFERSAVQKSSSRGSSFGVGELDQYAFLEDCEGSPQMIRRASKERADANSRAGSIELERVKNGKRGHFSNNETPKPKRRRTITQPGDIEKFVQQTAMEKQDLDNADPPTRIVAGALATAATTSGLQQSRKISVKTADYLNEAQRIMQFIRAEVRPHTSQDDSESPETSVLPESTIDDFSRPPSREGGSVRKAQDPAPPSDRVVSHLRRFEDKDDLGIALSSSLKSVPADVPRDKDDQPNTIDSNDGTTPSLSSKNSSKRLVIAPDMVADLLSDQMAGMFFDRTKGVWVKRRASQSQAPDNSISEETDLLFDDIPDLSIDEMDELRRVQDAVASEELSSVVVSPGRAQDLVGDASSVPSKISPFASSTVRHASTRATSWGEDLPKPRTEVLPTLAEERPSENQRARVVTVAFSSPLVRHDRSLVSNNSWLETQGALEGGELSLMKIPATTPIINRSNQSLISLSPLSEFTLRCIDRPLDPRSSKSQALSLTGQEVIRHLTDVEPFEPYWEHIKAADLRGRQLRSLHMLDQYCSRIEKLDISENELPNLEGIPGSVRRLNIQSNKISDLAAWDQLRNLQYLDISKNQLSSLRSLRPLFHLRELRIDYNEVQSLDGLAGLDGLIELRLAGNSITNVDFADLGLQRLSILDLSRNGLVIAKNLHALPSLQRLDLDDNLLENIVLTDKLPYLTHLSIANNRLRALNVSNLPQVKDINVDGNGLCQIPGLANLKHLQHVSWRGQSQDKIHIRDASEAQHLCLSENPLSILDPVQPFLSLRTLELASAGLQRLAPDLGLQCPNLRRINFNLNALKDIRPLLGIVKLQELHLAGNRLCRLRRTVSVLDRLKATLEQVDLRNNPLTVNFYSTNGGSLEAGQAMTVFTASCLPENYPAWPESSFRRHLVADADQASDVSYLAHLDQDTRLRRRVYEMMIARACPGLKRLDGLLLPRQRLVEEDAVWQRLCELGILARHDD